MFDFHSRIHRITCAVFGAGLLASLAYAPNAAWSWETAHGPPDNTGFVDVVTKPADYATKTVVDIGTFAPGAGPTAAQPGTPIVNQPGKPITGNAAQPSMPVATDAGQPVATPREQTYKPPMTVNGNRLFACEELDQDDCGKGDHKTISLAFCQAQGFTRVEDYDVDSSKARAETLDGRFCTKNKCKVFDTIDCANN